METETNPLEFARMTRTQKLAALLIMLGPDGAGQILRNLPGPELESVSLEMSRLTVISNDLQDEILREFTTIAIQASIGLRGGVEYAKAALEKSVGPQRAAEILGRVAPAPVAVPSAGLRQILDLDPRQLANLLQPEQPQTIALIASHLPPEKSSELLLLLRGDLREQVVEKLATLAPTSAEVLERIVEVLLRKAGARSPHALHHTGGLKSAAMLLNLLEKGLSRSLLSGLEQRNPELGQAIRAKLFTFEELALLDRVALQKILRETDTRDLAVALKSAGAELTTALLGALSRRAADAVREEISFLGPTSRRNIEAAQLRIIEHARRLEDAGELDLCVATTSATRDEILV